MSDTKLQPTYDTERAAVLCGRSPAWIKATAATHNIGRRRSGPRGRWEFTRADLRRLRALADPEETRGRPRKTVQPV